MKLLPGYEKAYNDNIPTVDVVLLGSFIGKDGNFISPEIRNVKAIRNGKESYGEAAIGFVQVKRVGWRYNLICAMCPEHKIRSKSYKVELQVNSKKPEIEYCICHDCVSSLGGCKHQLAFLGWIHRRSEEPTCTERIAYWKKSALSLAVASKPAADVVCPQKRRRIDNQLRKTSPSGSFLREVIDHVELKQSKSSAPLEMPEIARHFMKIDEFERLDIHCLLIDFKVKYPSSKCIDKFLEYCTKTMKKSLCEEAQIKTQDQYAAPMWRKLRYCRITASNFHQAAQCNTTDGVLVSLLFGATFRETPAMKRGIRLESQVLKAVERKKKMEFRRCGLFLDPKFPIFGASPDAISDDFVVEIKCPVSNQSSLNYLNARGDLTPKCKAQVQLQMKLSGRKKALFCVASPDFEKSKKVKIVTVFYDERFVSNHMEKAKTFWKSSVGKVLLS